MSKLCKNNKLTKSQLKMCKNNKLTKSQLKMCKNNKLTKSQLKMCKNNKLKSQLKMLMVLRVIVTRSTKDIVQICSFKSMYRIELS